LPTSPPAHRISGGGFDEARLSRELNELEGQAAAPDFWKDQAAAQKILQRRRRLDDDRALAESIRRQTADLGVLIEWAKQGEDVSAELTPALEAFTRDVQSAEVKTRLGAGRNGAVSAARCWTCSRAMRPASRAPPCS